MDSYSMYNLLSSGGCLGITRGFIVGTTVVATTPAIAIAAWKSS